MKRIGWIGLAVCMVSVSAICFPARPLNAEERKEITLDNSRFDTEEAPNVPAGWSSCVEKGTPSFRLVTDGNVPAEAGKKCVMIEGKSDESIASWIYTKKLKSGSDEYQIKGGTTYEYSCWVKTQGVSDTAPLLVWEFDDKAPIAAHTSAKVTGDSGWQKAVCRLTTKATGRGLQLRLNLNGKGAIWFAGVALAEITENRENASSNRLKNGSFEITTVPGQPDDWGLSGGGSGLGGVIGAHYTERFFDWFTIDSTTAYHGKNSFRIYRPFDDSDPNASSEYSAGDFILGSDWHLAGEIEDGFPYTFSCYLKSDPPGLKMKIQITGSYGQFSREVSATNAWNRYTLTTPLLKRSEEDPSGNMFIHLIPKQKGTFWIDALQLEKGESAGPYTPSQKDIMAMGQEIQPAVPKINCVKVSSAPKIDGILDDECYSKVPRLDLVLISDKTPREPTEGYIFQDGDNFYIGMKCHESRMDKIRAAVRNDDGPVWEDDSVEIFFDPELSRENYYRLGVNAAGVKFDGTMFDNAWNGAWETKTYRGADFWSVELKIPLGTFSITPLTGSTWGINLCRSNRVLEEYSCWSPVYTGFHNPKRFGEMTGIDSEKLKVFRYNLNGISLKTRADSKGYDVAVQAGNYTGSNRNVTLEAQVSTGKETVSAASDVLFQDGRQQEVRIGPFIVGEKGADRIVVNLHESQNKKLIASASSVKVRAPLPMEISPELNYYTDEKTASVFITNNLNKDVVASGKMTLTVELKDNQGNGIIPPIKVHPSDNPTRVEFPIKALKTGEYSIFARLMNGQGAVIGEVKNTLLKLEKSAGEVKINRINRMLVIDQNPVILVGPVLSVSMLGSDKEKNRNFYEKILSRYGRDFNCIKIYYWGSYEDLTSILDIAHKSNLKVDLGGIDGFDYSQEKIAELAPKIKDHPALLFWPAILDEVVANEEQSAFAHDRCERVKEVDPYHPVFILNHCVSLSSWEKFGYPGDIIEYHDYAFSSGRGGVPFWGSVVKEAGQIAKETHRPLLAMPQTFSSMQWWSRGPSADEIEASVYLALVHGATIIEYYTFDQAERNLWTRVRSVGKEMKELTPVLASYEPSPEISVNSSRINTLVKKYQGKYYLIAVNASNEAAEVSLDLSSLRLPGNSRARVMFENREISLRDSILKDAFAGYRRHVYEINFK